MAFDFSTPDAVMLILKSLRTHTELDAVVRNEIRDLIFSYTNGGRDDATRQTIETRLLAVGVTPASVAKSSNSSNSSDNKKMVPKGGFSTGRVAPSFTGSFAPASAAPVTTPIRQESQATPVAPKVVSKVELASKEIPTPVPKILPTFPSTLVSDFSTQKNNKNKEDATVVQSETKSKMSAAGTHDVAKGLDSKKQHEENEVVTKEVPSVQPTSTPLVSTEQNSSVDTAVLLERIRVIKADINARAGNPVNLVSIDNTVGREYMSTLLEAMKQLGSGNSSTISGAMKRLELAYEQALSVIEMNHASNTKQSKSIGATSAPVSTPTSPAPQVSSASMPPPSVTPTAVPVKAQVNQTSLSRVSAPTVPSQVSIPSVRPVSQVSTPATESAQSVPSASNPPLGATRPVMAVAQNQKPTPVPIESSQAEVMEASAPPASVPIHSSKIAPTKSVAMATPLRRVEELPTLAEVKNRSESGNPLYTGEINEGLEQLLSEWTIFRKSGVFGTGPRGSVHPLYKKLAPLKIPLIIAGRFEGATEEVRQSITDYMNGWRYEQGIVYEKEETFENYLRRVVHHIIDLQKK